MKTLKNIAIAGTAGLGLAALIAGHEAQTPISSVAPVQKQTIKSIDQTVPQVPTETMKPEIYTGPVKTRVWYQSNGGIFDCGCDPSKYDTHGHVVITVDDPHFDQGYDDNK